MSDNPVTILIVDDHKLLSSGLSMLLNAEDGFQVVGQAENTAKALERTKALQPQIILLDITLSNSSGLTLLPELLAASPNSRVIMLTMHNDCSYLQEAMEKGAKGFVLKKGIDVDLIYAIRLVMQGELYIHSSMLPDYLTLQHKESEKTSDKMLWHSLSNREREVMEAVSKGYTSREIGESLFLSEKTIATYRSRAMAKLGLQTRAELVSFMNRLHR